MPLLSLAKMAASVENALSSTLEANAFSEPSIPELEDIARQIDSEACVGITFAINDRKAPIRGISRNASCSVSSITNCVA
jgi:hypothetical protein